VTGILGGVFDPPHLGHLELARAAIRELRLEELLVLVVADPGHKIATTPAEARLELARLAFAEIPDALFVLGADELAAFETWKSPKRVLELVRIAVAMRPGVDRAEIQAARDRFGAGDRILEFELTPVAISSSEIRERVARGVAVDDVVPPAVVAAIARLGLYASPE
jgi:nicotinate-nucleotide adenylyltransferase